MGEYNLEYSCSFSPAREIIPRCVANIVFTSRLRKIWCTFTKKKRKVKLMQREEMKIPILFPVYFVDY